MIINNRMAGKPDSGSGEVEGQVGALMNDGVRGSSKVHGALTAREEGQ